MESVFVLSDFYDDICASVLPELSVTGAIESAFCAVIDAKKLTDFSIPKGVRVLTVFSENEKIEGCFDDFAVYPCTSAELVARISRLAKSERVFKNGALAIDFAKSAVTLDGKSVHLTMLEYRLLCLLAQNVGNTVSYESILSALWGSPIGSEIKSLRVFVNAIRAKLGAYGKEHIKTVSGKGYTLLKT